MKTGYARVSTGDQNLELQRNALRQAGCDRVYEEKISGVCGNRPALRAATRRLRRGDTLIVWKLDRLGRSLQDLVAILAALERRGISFYSVSDNIDTATPTGKLLFHVTGAMAEFERSLISERTKAGMAAARRAGISLGRPKKLDLVQKCRAKVLSKDGNQSLAATAREMDVSKTTVWRAVQEI